MTAPDLTKIFVYLLKINFTEEKKRINKKKFFLNIFILNNLLKFWVKRREISFFKWLIIASKSKAEKLIQISELTQVMKIYFVSKL